MNRRELKKAFQNAWILWFVVVVAVLLFFGFTLQSVPNPPPPKWEMGEKPFVPASSLYANDYYAPVPEKQWEAF